MPVATAQHRTPRTTNVVRLSVTGLSNEEPMFHCAGAACSVFALRGVDCLALQPRAAVRQPPAGVWKYVTAPQSHW